MAEDMTTPFVLGLIGGIVILIVGILVTIAGAVIGSRVPLFGGAVGGIFAALGIWGLIDGVLIVVGSIFMRDPAKAKLGAILTLIFGILGFFTVGYGLVFAPILAIVGGALGISKSK